MDDKLLSECTVDELLDALFERTETGVVCLHIPDDGDVCGTHTSVWGNRAAAVGLATLAVEHAMGRLREQHNKDGEGRP